MITLPTVINWIYMSPSTIAWSFAWIICMRALMAKAVNKIAILVPKNPSSRYRLPFLRSICVQLPPPSTQFIPRNPLASARWSPKVKNSQCVHYRILPSVVFVRPQNETSCFVQMTIDSWNNFLRFHNLVFKSMPTPALPYLPQSTKDNNLYDVRQMLFFLDTMKPRFHHLVNILKMIRLVQHSRKVSPYTFSNLRLNEEMVHAFTIVVATIKHLEAKITPLGVKVKTISSTLVSSRTTAIARYSCSVVRVFCMRLMSWIPWEIVRDEGLVWSIISPNQLVRQKYISRLPTVHMLISENLANWWMKWLYSVE